MKNFYFPQCATPVLLLNQNALRMLADGGVLNYNGIIKKLPNINSLPLGQFIEHGYNILKLDENLLSNFYVTLNDISEYFFQLVDCGKCPLCLRRKQIDLVNRATLETELYDCPPYFVTLTYDSQHLPPYSQLRYSDVQKFLKRLRMRWTRKGLQHNIRYIVCGEYGKTRMRPHYHMIIFNNPYHCCELDFNKHLEFRNDVFESWNMCQPQGFDFGQCQGGAASYATKYLAKDNSKDTHFVKPFVRASTGHGGIGSGYLKQIKKIYNDNPVLSEITFISKIDGLPKHITLGKYANRTLFPSMTSLVPLRLRESYRQLNSLLPFLVRFDVITSSYAFELSEVLRPSKYIRNKFTLKGIEKITLPKCHLKRMLYANTFRKVLNHLFDVLSEQYVDDEEYYKKLLAHRENTLARPDNHNSLAQQYLNANLQHSLAMSKEIL